MKCPKCSNSFFTMSAEADSGCVNCGYFPTVISSEVAAEVEENLNRAAFPSQKIQLPSLPKWMPAYALSKTDRAGLDRKPGRPRNKKSGSWFPRSHHKQKNGVLRIRKRDAKGKFVRSELV